jgi:hypothetical protein
MKPNPHMASEDVIFRLAERIKKLTAPCRQADLDIALAMGICEKRGDFIFYRWEGKSTKAPFSPPNYTASVSCALSLMNPQWEAALYVGGTNTPCVQVETEYTRATQREPFSVELPELPLAICGAAMLCWSQAHLLRG